MTKDRPKRVPNGGKGRPPGFPNKMPKEAKELAMRALLGLQADPNTCLETWAKENKTEFYTKIFPRLLPKDVTVGGDGITIIVNAAEVKQGG